MTGKGVRKMKICKPDYYDRFKCIAGACSDICREHPRYYDWYDGYTEMGVGLCCEAAVRLILENEQPTQFLMAETDEAGEDEVTESPEERAWIGFFRRDGFQKML